MREEICKTKLTFPLNQDLRFLPGHREYQRVTWRAGVFWRSLCTSHTRVRETHMDHVLAARQEGLAVLDIRSNDEYYHGHVEGSTHIPYQELQERIFELPPRKSALLVVTSPLDENSTKD